MNFVKADASYMYFTPQIIYKKYNELLVSTNKKVTMLNGEVRLE